MCARNTYYFFRNNVAPGFPAYSKIFYVTTTVMSIVTADIHQGLYQPATHLAMLGAADIRRLEDANFADEFHPR